MGRAGWRAVLACAACAVFGCHLRKESVADAGGPLELEAGVTDGATSADAAPGALVEPSVNAEGGQKHPEPRCATGEVTVLLSPSEETCVVECRSSAECPPEWSCDGDAPISRGGRPGNVIRFCRNVAHGKLADGGLSHSVAPSGHSGTQLDAGHSAPGSSPAKKPEPHDSGAKGK